MVTDPWVVVIRVVLVILLALSFFVEKRPRHIEPDAGGLSIGDPVPQGDVRTYDIGTAAKWADARVLMIQHPDGRIEIRKGDRMMTLVDADGRVLLFDSELRVKR